MSENTLSSLEDLSQYIDDVECWLNSMTDQIQCPIDELATSNNVVMCPFKSNHIMPGSSLEKHVQLCRWKSQGYTAAEIEKSSSSTDFYEKAPDVVSVKLNVDAVAGICGSSGRSGDLPQEMPLTADRYVEVFTPQQRLRMYEHVAQVARATRTQAQMSADQYSFLTEDLVKKQAKAEKNKPKTHLELLAMKRDMKRRRQSYKGKSYTAKKSQKQIIADVIHNQTEILREMWTAEKEERKHARLKSELNQAKNDDVEPQSDHESSQHLKHKRKRRSRSRSPKAKKHKRKSRDRSRCHTPKSKKKKKKRSKSRETSSLARDRSHTPDIAHAHT